MFLQVGGVSRCRHPSVVYGEESSSDHPSLNAGRGEAGHSAPSPPAYPKGVDPRWAPVSQVSLRAQRIRKQLFIFNFPLSDGFESFHSRRRLLATGRRGALGADRDAPRGYSMLMKLGIGIRLR